MGDSVLSRFQMHHTVLMFRSPAGAVSGAQTVVTVDGSIAWKREFPRLWFVTRYILSCLERSSWGPRHLLSPRSRSGRRSC